MDYDPWAVSSEDGAADVQDNELDLTDCFADESVPATPYILAGSHKPRHACLFMGAIGPQTRCTHRHIGH